MRATIATKTRMPGIIRPASRAIIVQSSEAVTARDCYTDPRRNGRDPLQCRLVLASAAPNLCAPSVEPLGHAIEAAALQAAAS
jgi:hypothetical protein